MVRLLFWIALIAAAFWLWRKFKASNAATQNNSLEDPLKMVRCAQGKMDPNVIRELLAHNEKRKTSFAAPAAGLYLVRVLY